MPFTSLFLGLYTAASQAVVQIPAFCVDLACSPRAWVGSVQIPAWDPLHCQGQRWAFVLPALINEPVCVEVVLSGMEKRKETEPDNSESS